VVGVRRRTRIATSVALTWALAAAVSAAGTPPEVKRYFKLWHKASKQLDRQQYAPALKTLQAIGAVAPDNPPHYSIARAHAALGHRDAAFAELRQAVELGGPTADGLRNAEELAVLRDDPRFDESVRAAELDEQAFTERTRTLYRAIDPRTAQAFESAEALAKAFDERGAELQRHQVLIPWRTFYARSIDLQNARIAALERYLTDHADAADRERALNDSVEAVVELREDYEGWGPEAQLVTERAERYLAEFPQGEHAAEVELKRAVAELRAFDNDDSAGRAATLGARTARALPLFEAVERAHSSTPQALWAQAWRLRALHEAAGGAITPAQRELYARIQTQLKDAEGGEALTDQVWGIARPALFQMSAETDFEGTDLAGRRWTLEAMRGHVVLVDFWATWCGPCMGEIPRLKEAYAKYHDRGFEIVGVSLDGGKREQFEKALAKHGIAWPQIWDGKGWQAAVARRFRIQGIPSPFLLDREGRVVAWDFEARGKKLADRVAQLVE
jgi:thiol-disulfide isomerase/thioredoxin